MHLIRHREGILENSTHIHNKYFSKLEIEGNVSNLIKSICKKLTSNLMIKD